MKPVSRSGRIALVAAALVAAASVAHAAVRAGGVNGTWRVYSSTLYYDAGGGATMPPTTRKLILSGARWRFGASSGRYAVRSIAAADWTRWGVKAYGPTKKIVLAGWMRKTADGPIETSGTRTDFIWVVYRGAPPVVADPGTVWLKFGH